jgi:MoaA/NifB/PqqE/SkfB family radical SAM enzyme
MRQIRFRTRDVPRSIARRLPWIFHSFSPRKSINLAASFAQFAVKTEKAFNWPLIVKIDISPACNLRCLQCLHATPNGDPTLERQDFTGSKRMSLDQYKAIVDEIRGKTSAVSLYYMGDPLVHPDVVEMCQFASGAGLSIHTSSNFSFSLTDERIKRILTSGVTHFSVCVDGLNQDTYSLTRVGGRLDRVVDNLRRICELRRQEGLKYPHIEVQYIKFQHNLDQLDEARKLFEEIGVDQLTEFWGSLHNYVDCGPDRYTVYGPKKKPRWPYCKWPHFSTVIKYNGDVIPCCWYREGEQYTRDGDARVIGNVFETSLKEIWRSQEYQEIRRIVADPEAADSLASSRDSFCYGCSQLYDTNRADARRIASNHRFEDLYTLGKKNIPIRRPETRAWS